MSEREEILERALTYPYEIPDRSFLQIGGRTLELPDERVLEGRHPVLALGSNAAPEVLIRKFERGDPEDPVPVVRAALSGFDIVYSAHISAYGSIPAALQVSAETTVFTYVTYFSDSQLDLMSGTEPNYDLVLLEEVSCELETGGSLSRVASYLSKHGCLTIGDSEVALSDVPARGRRFPTMSEPETLEHVKAELSPAQTMEDFIVENVEDPELAKARTRLLRGNAKRFAGNARRSP